MIGPRQAGKTTLARQLAESEISHFFDLEDPRDAARLASPMLALESLSGLVVLDEIQTLPQLFPALRVQADRHIHGACTLPLARKPGKTRSQSPQNLLV
jgi:uncharacterized protein